MSERKKIEKEHDEILSKYIRMRDSGTCYCGYKNPDYQDKEGNTKPGWMEMANGHLFSRSFDGTRWLELNCHCSCMKCNDEHERNESRYVRWFIMNYGQDKYNELLKKASVNFLPEIEWHLEKIEELNEKIRKLKEENFNL